jgi:hypothetical protein
MRRKLASHIIRHVNDGESDPTRLADSAIVSIFGNAAVARRDQPSTASSAGLPSSYQRCDEWR